MSHPNRLNRLQMPTPSPRGLTIPSLFGGARQRYRRILVSTTLDDHDRASLLLGFELASLYDVDLTVLHVAPATRTELDAIGLLHDASYEFCHAPVAELPAAAETAWFDVDAFIEDAVPPYLRGSVDWSKERRSGDLAGCVVTHVNESGADLVVLAAKPSRWWLPKLAFDLWTIRRRARASVIVIRPQARSFAS